MASEPDLMRDLRRRAWAGDSPVQQSPVEPRPPMSVRELVYALIDLAGRVGWDAPVVGFEGDPVQVVEDDDGGAVGVF